MRNLIREPYRVKAQHVPARAGSGADLGRLLKQRLEAAEKPPRAERRAARGDFDAARPHDALLALDIETVVDAGLLPSDWPADRFPKPAWHRVVAVSFVEAKLVESREGQGEAYRIVSCRSGGDPNWNEERLLRTFWRFFEAGRYRIVTWNGRAFDIPTLLMRSMLHGIAAPSWFRRGTRWAGYGSRFESEWHVDLMDAMACFGATSRMTLEEAAAMIGLPGKLGEHGSEVGGMVERGEIERVRAYCETDCLNLYLLYLRWAHLTGRTLAADHDEAVGDVLRLLDDERGAKAHFGAFADAWRQLPGRTPFVSREQPGCGVGLAVPAEGAAPDLPFFPGRNAASMVDGAPP
ncbi:conserved hypothetical protein (plasmid) [Methylorubrum extorquens CM4]|uniref:Predicted 3'-5' exonuclease PolB-like domain-containing protein n=2 Tax=Methylorubrum extorquens TaxID=408 RepID=B7L3I2_METC4|nr:conserved hypothetical protein [Methylorubrum extorquens CM4]